MPVINIEENIKMLRDKIEKMTQELFRMQGMLQTFDGFKKGGLKTIDLPNAPNQEPDEEPDEELKSLVEELKSTQEKPE